MVLAQSGLSGNSGYGSDVIMMDDSGSINSRMIHTPVGLSFGHRGQTFARWSHSRSCGRGCGGPFLSCGHRDNLTSEALVEIQKFSDEAVEEGHGGGDLEFVDSTRQSPNRNRHRIQKLGVRDLCVSGITPFGFGGTTKRQCSNTRNMVCSVG